MLPALLRAAASAGARAGAAPTVAPHASRAAQLQARRWFNVHEYQASQLLAKHGVNVPPGVAVHKVEDVAAAAKEMAGPDGEVVVKAQVLAGGRGLGKFTNGLQGGVHIVPAADAPALAARMLGGTLVTKQTGAAGKPVNTLLVARKMDLAREMYLAILLDRKAAGPVVVACSEGGTSIEDLAASHPDKIVKVPVDPRVGLTDAQTADIVRALGVTRNLASAAQQVKGLYDTFVACDCTLVEVNPLAETSDGRLLAADAKLGFDDSAAFRQKDLFALRDPSQEDPREVAASRFDLNYIGLDGNIGCMVNGAGLAMATMDIIKLHGGSPANFLDVGGNASEGQVVEAFKILTADPQVKALLVNIFGGIMKCDVIASGIVNAAKQVGVSVPLVVRLEGTNVEAGKAILAAAAGEVPVIPAADLDDAAAKAVAALSA